MAERRIFSSRAENCPVARHYVEDIVRASGRVVDFDVLNLLTSELVANAIAYGGEESFAVGVHLDGVVRVEVADHRPGELPQVQQAPRNATSGRGMAIVEQLAQHWGTCPEIDSSSKVVWFEIGDKGATANPS